MDRAAIAAWAQQSPLTLQDAVTGVLVGFITFYSLRWIAGIVLRKEAIQAWAMYYFSLR